MLLSDISFNLVVLFEFRNKIIFRFKSGQVFLNFESWSDDSISNVRAVSMPRCGCEFFHTLFHCLSMAWKMKNGNTMSYVLCCEFSEIFNFHRSLMAVPKFRTPSSRRVPCSLLRQNLTKEPPISLILISLLIPSRNYSRHCELAHFLPFVA